MCVCNDWITIFRQVGDGERCFISTDSKLAIKFVNGNTVYLIVGVSRYHRHAHLPKSVEHANREMIINLAVHILLRSSAKP